MITTATYVHMYNAVEHSFIYKEDIKNIYDWKKNIPHV
jgi:hypothetical protein